MRCISTSSVRAANSFSFSSNLHPASQYYRNDGTSFVPDYREIFAGGIFAIRVRNGKRCNLYGDSFLFFEQLNVTVTRVA